MPLGSKPECAKCRTRETPLWHSTDAGNLCNACLEDERNAEANSSTKTDEEDKSGSLRPRRSTRITRYCNAKATGPHKVIPKGKGRRNLFKKTPVKAPTATATPVTNQYCEKSAAVTWLLPTTASPPPEEGFTPETYIIGPEEDLPRKLECMEFVMHAPSDYFKLKNTPYPPALTEKGIGYIWTDRKSVV